MNATAPGRIRGRSPAPTPETTRTATIGRSCRSTRSTRTPPPSDHDAIAGGVHGFAADGAGGAARNGASTVDGVSVAATGAAVPADAAGAASACRAEAGGTARAGAQA